jgi:hypothetical protein
MANDKTLGAIASMEMAEVEAEYIIRKRKELTR